MLAVGVDDCGSITYPASVNSCVGLRPTIGLVSRTGLFSYSQTETTPGPVARTVADAARMLDVLAGPASHSTYADACGLESIRGRRIGILAAVDPVDVMGDVPASIREAFASRLAAMEAEGAVLLNGLRLDGMRWGRKSGLEHYNAQVQSLRARTDAPRTPRQLYRSDQASPVVRQFRGHPLWGFGPPFRLPNIYAAGSSRVIRHNQTAFARLLAEAGVEVVMTVTGSAPSRVATLTQIPHLTIPAGSVAADPELAAHGFVEGSTVPWGLSLLAGPGQDREVLALGSALEKMFNGRVVPRPTATADGHTTEEFDIERFNRFKKEIAHRSSRSLQLDADGREYVHPTADEFRALVSEITAQTPFELS
jgi:Asp-tRNA(Asn)/Glu-tRNA(Gln) amidotransferase A subunit family amidase